MVANCIFCDIIGGEAPASFVYEDDICVAFMDIDPVSPGHTLVVPRVHAAGLHDLDEAVGMHLFKIAQRAARALRRSGLRCDGINLFLADGEAAWQDIFHLHLHVIPRFPGDGFHIKANWGHFPPRAALDANAALIAAAWGQLDHAHQA